jgi:hypothetical protein
MDRVSQRRLDGLLFSGIEKLISNGLCIWVKTSVVFHLLHSFGHSLQVLFHFIFLRELLKAYYGSMEGRPEE